MDISNWHFYLALLFAAGALVTGALHIVAEYQEDQAKVYLYKPLTMILLLAVAITAPQPISLFYKGAIVLGLILSLTGDVFLMLPGRLLLAGLMQFLIAHIVYIYAFGSVTHWALPSPWKLGLLLIGGGIYWLLAPYLREMKWPVVIYMAAILLMAWQALEMYTQVNQLWTLAALLGALLFVASDTALAFNEFRRHFSHAHALVLGTYYAAQLLIAFSAFQWG